MGAMRELRSARLAHHPILQSRHGEPGHGAVLPSRRIFLLTLLVLPLGLCICIHMDACFFVFFCFFASKSEIGADLRPLDLNTGLRGYRAGH